MAGVQAPADVGRRQQPLHIGRALHHRAGVRMEREREAVVGDQVLDHRDALDEGGELAVVERRRLRPVGIHQQGTDEHVGAGGGEHRRGVRRGAAGGVERRLVQHEGHEAPDQREPVGVQPAAQCERIAGEVAERSQLGRREPETRHLGEHAVGRELAAPAGHLAHPP
jgi:hypothetical protein